MSIQGGAGDTEAGLFGTLKGTILNLTVEGRIVQEYTDAQLKTYSDGSILVAVGGLAGDAASAGGTSSGGLYQCVSRVDITTNAPCVRGLGAVREQRSIPAAAGDDQSTLAPGDHRPHRRAGLCGRAVQHPERPARGFRQYRQRCLHQ